MFISRINKNYKFSKEKWLVSVISCSKIIDEMYKASLIIEGVVNRQLLFACYDIYSKKCETATAEKPRAYLHHIDCFEGTRYQGDFQRVSAISYHAKPGECQKLSDQLHDIAKLFENNALPPEIIIFPVSIEKASLHWCLNFLSEFDILRQSESLF